MFSASKFVVLLLVVSTINHSLSKNIGDKSEDSVGSKNGDNEPENPQQKSNDIQCGGVLKAHDDELRILSYREETPSNVRYQSCIWTITAINRTTIQLNVTENFQNHISTFLAIGYFNNSNYDESNSLVWKYVYSSGFVEVPGPVAFIHYSSEAVLPTYGFSLTYEASGTQSSNYNFNNYFVEGEYGKYDFPPVGEQFGSNQRTTVVVKAHPTLPVEGNPRPTWMYFINKGLPKSTNCETDSVNVFQYQPSSKKWIKAIGFCGSTILRAYTIDYPRVDPIIVTYTSATSYDQGAFQWQWYNSKVNEGAK